VGVTGVAGGVEVPAVPAGPLIGRSWRDAAGGESFDAVSPSTAAGAFAAAWHRDTKGTDG